MKFPLFGRTAFNSMLTRTPATQSSGNLNLKHFQLGRSTSGQTKSSEIHFEPKSTNALFQSRLHQVKISQKSLKNAN
jgi:hypothetical protein